MNPNISHVRRNLEEKIREVLEAQDLLLSNYPPIGPAPDYYERRQELLKNLMDKKAELTRTLDVHFAEVDGLLKELL